MTWEPVVFADELPVCEWCGEPWCERHQLHYGDCDCIGPTEDGVELQERDGVLYGRRVEALE